MTELAKALIDALDEDGGPGCSSQPHGHARLG
jgi:hypothetical protein